MTASQTRPAMQPQQHYGYKYGITQPGVALVLKLDPQAADHLGVVDAHLAQSFDVTLEACRWTGPADVDASTQAGIDLAWRILLLGQSLLQAVRAPVFDPGKVLEARPIDGKPGRLAVRVFVPWFDHMETGPLHQAYQAAARVVTALAKPDPAEDRTETLLRNLHEQFVKPLARLMPGGESSVPVLANAFHQGIPFRHLSGGTYILGWGSQAKLMDRSAVESDSMIGSSLSSNKLHSANLLHAAGLPAPQHILARNEQQANHAAETIGWPVVIKPVDRERGEGVVTGISDHSALLEAYENAAKLSQRGVLVERQVAGVCHRIYLSFGQILYATKRMPKLVTGDGIHTVAELIESANAQEQTKVPWRRLKPFPDDDEASQCLAEAGLDMNSIPVTGEKAPLRQIEATIWGGVTEDQTDAIHPHNREMLIRAAQLFKLDSAGIDIITPDIGVPWYENGAIINEVNYAPLLGSHRTGYKLGGALAEIVARLVEGDGRIPVEVIVGKDSLDAARQRQRELHDRGVACFVAGSHVTLGPVDVAIHTAAHGLFARCRALLMNRATESLVIAVQTNEFEITGLPVDRISRISILDDDVQDWRDNGDKVGPDGFQSLIDLLTCYTVDKIQA